MRISNVHERLLLASSGTVGALLDGLASETDRLWPSHHWPRIRLDPGLRVGARGGHGPARYDVVQYEPGQRVTFRFRCPTGFVGHHWFEVKAHPAGTLLRHTVDMEVRGLARLSWPLVFRPLHDALLEDALDLAELATAGRVAHPARWPLAVRVLRTALRVLRSRHPPSSQVARETPEKVR